MTTRTRRKDDELIGRLKQVPLFSSCTAKELKAIAAASRTVEFETGETICHEGKAGVGLHVILEGETKVSIRGRTRRRLGPGAFFGEIALLDGGPRTATVTAETPVKALVLPAWSFRSVMEDIPSLPMRMLEETARRLRTSGASITN
jgi:CRP-like cAMP-binding protein